MLMRYFYRSVKSAFRFMIVWNKEEVLFNIDLKDLILIILLKTCDRKNMN